jgi:hypothetical protein
MDRTVLWVARVAWLLLPVTVGAAASRAGSDTSTAIHAVAAVELWALWAVGLVAVLVPTTASLTVLRLLAPAPVLVAAVALVAHPDLIGVFGLVVGAVVVVAVFRPGLGRLFCQGSAYGDEARYPLRPPGALVLGPLPLLWLFMAAAVAGGPLLLAARQWAPGVVLTLIAALALAVLPRRFHLLSRRFLVFVPAGLVLHDHLVLAETALFRWIEVRSVERALAGTTALDLTGGALGAALEVTLDSEQTVVRATGRARTPVVVATPAFLCRPTLLDDALAEASSRRAARR